MGEYDFTDNLVSLPRFSSSSDASLALARLKFEGIDACLEDDSSATALGDFEADLVGTSLLVRQGDFRRAKDILAKLEEDYSPEEEYSNEPIDDYDANDWVGEDWADSEDDLEEEYSEEPTSTPPMVRAWRAAIIGGVLIPLLVLNIYSMWIIFRYRLWEPQPGEKVTNWRFYASLAFNFFGAFIFWAIVR